MNNIEEIIFAMDDDLVGVDVPIYDMIMYHCRTGSKFIPMDKPKEMCMGWKSCSNDFIWFGIRLADIKKRKRSKILDLFGLGTEKLINIDGRQLIAETFTDINSSKYIYMPNLVNFITMNEALE